MYWNFIHYLFNHFFPDSVRHYSATFASSSHGCKFKDTCLLRWLDIFAALNFSLTNTILATQLLWCTCMHVPKSCIIILYGKCFIRKIQCIICFACRSVLTYFCYYMFYFLHISFYKYAFMQTNLSRATWSLCTLSKLEHTIFRRRCIQSVYLLHAFCAYSTARYKNFVKSFTCLYLNFT